MALPAGAVAGDEVVRWLNAEQAWHADKLTGALAWALMAQEFPVVMDFPLLDGVAKSLARVGVRAGGAL